MKPLRIIGSLLAILVTLEICARMDDWLAFRAPLFSSYSVDNLYELDGNRIRGKPFGRYKKWQLNSMGLRGPELRPGSVRILCIGASETFGMLESDGLEYPRQLQSTLNNLAGRPRYDVINLSYFGLKLPTANALLPGIVDTVHPRIAIIYLTYGGYVAPRPAHPRPETLDSPWFAPRLFDKLNDLAHSILPQGLQNWVKAKWMNHYVGTRTLMERTPEDRLATLTEDLRESVTLLRSRGVEPVIVTHANRFSDRNDPFRKDMLIAWRKFYPLVSEAGLLDMDERLNDAARRFAAANGVMLIDAATRMPGGPRYFTDYTHFTDEGAHTFARILAQEIQPLLNAADTSDPAAARAVSR